MSMPQAIATMSATDAARELNARVRSALRFAASIRALECVLVGGSAAACTLAAALFSGMRELAFDARAAAALSAAMAALAWWLERRPRTAAIVRRIDRSERALGELFTAYEIARANEARARGHASTIERASDSASAANIISASATDSTNAIDHALMRRALEKLPTSRAVRAAAPRSAVILAVPLASLAALFFAIDRAGERELDPSAALDAGSVAAVSSDLASASRSLRAASARAGASAAVADATTRAPDASTPASDANSRAPTRLRELDALADDVDRARRDLDAGRLSALDAASELAAEHDRARALASSPAIARDAASEAADAERALRAARAAIDRKLAGRSTPADASSSQAEDAARDRSNTDSDSRSSVNAGGTSSLSTRESVGTKRATDAARERNDAGDRATRTAPSSNAASAADASSSDERGTSSGRWWPRRYDDVVQRWVESQRERPIDPPRAR
jgi:hypothetical protein